jgi:hypothetical protein
LAASQIESRIKPSKTLLVNTKLRF